MACEPLLIQLLFGSLTERVDPTNGLPPRTVGGVMLAGNPGVTDRLEFEKTPCPAAVTGATWNIYVVPLTRPVTACESGFGTVGTGTSVQLAPLLLE